MVNQTIRILHLEDDAADAELVQAKLEVAGITHEITCVQTRDAFIESLRMGEFDVILADYKLPMFDGISAMHLVRDSGLDVPFIFISGIMGEDAAIECLTNGATDYVLKQKLSRLAPAVKRALHESENRRKRRQAEESLWESEAFHRAIVEAFDGLIYICSQDYRVEFMNQRFIDRTGYDGTGHLCYRALHNLDQVCPWCVNERVWAGETVYWEIESPKDHRWYYVSNSPIRHPDGTMSKQALILDITERKHSEKKKAILNEIAKILLTIPDEEMYGEVLGVVLRVMGSAYGTFGFIGRHGELVVPSMTRDIWDWCRVIDKAIVFPSDSWGDSMWGRAIREQRSLSSDAPFNTPEGHIHIDHFLAVPIIYGSEAIGLISVANKEGGYTGEDKDLLERIAVFIAPILNARLQRDAQELKRMEAETALRESEEKYRILVENAGEAIFIIQDEMVKFPNPCTLEIMGYTAEELAKTPFIYFIHPDDRVPVYKKHLESPGMDRSHASYRFRIMGKMGKELWVQLTMTPITWERRSGLLCFLRDITEEQRLEAKLIQAQKMEALGTLASGIAHDFNNILTPIIGYTEMSLDLCKQDEELNKNLHEVLSASQRAKELVSQILVYTRQTVAEPKPIQVGSLVKETLNFLKSSVSKTISIHSHVRSNSRVMAPPTYIHQILMNLCVNSIQAMGETDGILEVILDDIEIDETFVSLHPEGSPGKYVVLSVQDTGCGMTKEVMERIFDPYFTTKKAGVGTGLGLPIVLGLVRKNNGIITVESTPGRGSTFKVFLPVQEEVTTPVITSDEGILPTGKESILFVDNDYTIVRYCKQMLTGLGYSVTARVSSREALILFRRNPHFFDLVITDMMMPFMTGDRLAKEMIKIRSDIPIILCTGYEGNITEVKAKEAGIKGVILKPILKYDLADMMRKVLEDSKEHDPQ